MITKPQLKKKFQDHKTEIILGSVTFLATASAFIAFNAYQNQSDDFEEAEDGSYGNLKNWVRVQITKPDIETMLTNPEKSWYSVDRKPYVEVSIVDSY